MKKLIATTLLFVIVLTILSSCSLFGGNGKTEKIRVGYLTGPTGIGMAKLIIDNNGLNGGNEKYEFINFADNVELAMTSLATGKVDIVCLPTDNAAMYPTKTQRDAKILAVNCLNSLFLATEIGTDHEGDISLADFEELIDILKNKKLTFSVGYMYRFNPQIKEAMQKIESGKLGKIYSVEAHMDCKHKPEVRKWLRAFPGGMMFFLGCHLIDLIYKIQGEPSEIIPLNTSTEFDGIESKDCGMVVFKYPHGVSFAKASASEFGGFLRRQLVICGEKGTIEINPLEVLADGGIYTVSNESYSASWHEPPVRSQSEVFDRYDSMMRNFGEIVRGKENPYSYDYELNLYRLILKSCGKKI